MIGLVGLVGLLLLAVPIGLAIAFVLIARLKGQVEALEGRAAKWPDDALAKVIARVYALERRVAELSEAPAAMGAVAAVPEVTAPPVVKRPEAPPRLAAATPPTRREPLWPEPILAEPAPAPTPSWRARLRERMQGQQWEAVLGGSLLNKIGAGVTVIGVALFLSYSLGRLGPAGRVALGLLVSVAMLLTGVLLERSPRYLIYARGLIGGGWAALYFTAYAAHALEAARVIASPLAAALLLEAVAAGMIVHSLRYRSQVLSGMTYYLAYLALAITPHTMFSVVALIPLSISLLGVAHRFGWNVMAVLGAPSTYGIYLAVVAHSRGGSLASAQVVLLLYWVWFEAFDVLHAAQRRPWRGWVQALLPLNACGLVTASSMVWAQAAPGKIHQFLAIAAAAYTLSAVVRSRLLRPSSFPAEAGWTDRLRAGGYEPAAALAALLAAVGLGAGCDKSVMNFAWLAEAEGLFLMGLLWRQDFLRWLGACLFGPPAFKLFALDWIEAGQTVVAGRAWMQWTPTASLLAALCWTNRALRQASRYYGYAAAAVLVWVIGFEAPLEYRGLAWLLLAGVLLELGLREGMADFRHQAYLAGAAALVALGAVNVFGAGVTAARPGRLPQVLSALVLAAAAARLRSAGAATVGEGERGLGQNVAAAAGSAMLAALLWNLLPAEMVGPAWAAESLLLVEAGYALQWSWLRSVGHLAGAAAFGRLFLANFAAAGVAGWVSHRLLTVGPVIVLHYYLRARVREAGEPNLARAYFYTAAILAATLIRFEFGRVMTVTGWAGLALLLLIWGTWKDHPDLRWQSLALAGMAFVRSWTTNFYEPGSLGGIEVRVLTGALVILNLYASQFVATRRLREGAGPDVLKWLDQNARTVFSVLGSTLLAVLLYYEVSGSLLTVAWGLQGLALLGVGFPSGERSLRLSGLLLFLVCVLKLFLYDLRHLELPYRILSFLVLGALLLAVSWVYTRFRERIRRLF